MKEDPKISVIIPCFNAGKFLGETIDSVLEQDYPALEIILVDDGSTDNSRAVACSFGSAVTLVEQENLGGCAARNRGAALASGSFLMFLDADDLLQKGALYALVAACFSAGPEPAISVGSWGRFEKRADGWLEVESGVPSRPPKNDPIEGWLSSCWWVPPAGVLWSRAAYNQTNGWDEDLSANQDGDIMLRALLQNTRLCYVDFACALYREHGSERISVSKDVFSARALRSRMAVLEKCGKDLEASGRLSEYSVTIAQAYHRLGRNNVVYNQELAEQCLRLAEEYGGSRSVTGTFGHRVMCRVLGVRNKERLIHMLSSAGLVRKKRRIALKLERTALRGDER